MNGGEIDFVFTANTDRLEKVFNDAEKGLLGLTDIAKKAGEGIDSVFDISKENINIQKQVIAELESKYKDLSKAIEEIAPGTAKLTMMKEAASIKAEIEAEKKSLIELESNLKSTETTYKSFQSKLNEVKNEMRELEIAGQQNSSRYAELSQKAAEYQKANESVNKSLKALKDNAGLTALVETMGLASGVFSTYQGITALVGKENEDLEKIMIRLQSAIAVTVGIQQIQNSLSKESSLLQSIQAVQTLARAKADEIAAASTGKATIAQRAFNLVANANPYVLLATAIITVVGALYLYSNKTKSAVDNQKDLNDAVKDGIAETAKEMVKLEQLYKTATNDKLSREQRLKAVKDLKAAYPGLFANINEEIIMNGKAAASYLAVKAAILESAKAKAAQTILEKRMSEHLLEQEEIQKKIDKSTAERNKLKGEVLKGNKSKTVRMDGGDGKGFNVTYDNETLLRNERLNIDKLVKEKEKAEQQFNEANNSLISVVQKGNKALSDATTAPPPNKGTIADLRSQVAALEKENEGLKPGMKKLEENRKKIEELNKLIDPPKEKIKKPKKAKEVADEFLPEGSVAEIQRRLSKIDEALSKATTDSQRNDLKAKRISTAKELAEAEKLIQIKTLQEQFDESEKLWQQYYNTVYSLDKETADKIYGDLLKNDKSSYDALIKQRDALKNKANLTDEERNYFSFIDEKINSMLGKQSRLETFKQTIEETLGMLGTDAEKLKFLDEQKTTANKTTGEYAVLEDYNRKIQEEQKKRYQEFLKSTEDFNKKLTEIQKIYAEQRQLIYNDEKLTEEQKQKALIQSDKLENDAISEALSNSIINDPLFTQNFEKLGEYSFAQFDKIREALLKKLEQARNSGLDENSDVVQRIIERLRQLDEAASRNPFSDLINDWKKFIDAMKEGSNDIQGIAGKVAAGASMVNKSISIGLGIAQDLGLQFDENTQDVINDVQTTVAGIGDIAAGIASKNPMQVIKGIAGVVKGLAGLFNGDKKKERQIKAWADQVENLKIQYQELERAMNKALGDDKYKNQQEQIANLERQKILLQQMIKKEEDKKKTDKGKIKDWQQQISDINNQISDIKDNIVNDILQIDVKGLADKIGDALIDGFGRGEDALQSLNKTADEIFKDMVKNALKMQLEKNLQPVLSDMLKAMGYTTDSKGNPTGSFDGLTEEERAAIKAQIIAATGDYQKAMEQYADLFGPDVANNPNGLKGDIKGITEKTAGALEGQINAIRIYQVESLNTQKANQNLLADSLKNLVMIEYNTRMLHVISRDIAELNSKVSKPLAGLN